MVEILKLGLVNIFKLTFVEIFMFGSGMCGAAFYSVGRGGVGAKVKIHGAGRGEGENPRGGAGRGGAKKRANQPIQKIYKSAKNIILHIIILIIIYNNIYNI